MQKSDRSIIRLKVHISGEVFMFSKVYAMKTIAMYIDQLREEFKIGFNIDHPFVIYGIYDKSGSVIPSHYALNIVFHQDEMIFPLRSMFYVNPPIVYPLILRLPKSIDEFHAFSHETPSKKLSSTPVYFSVTRSDFSHDLTLDLQSKRPVVFHKTIPCTCYPYCLPTSFGRCSDLCGVCGLVRAFIPQKPLSKDLSLCSEYCYRNGKRQSKVVGFDFCRDCLFRYKKGGVMKGVPHQCKCCLRPWMKLNKQGMCIMCVKVKKTIEDQG
ncbi:hypothetical protein ADUPG1_014224 [Aduncisulcus paluster]|uniref:Uncharacterized protein n=1 Tax=Aduncisulcus paluster TaxID=2918883 RepID=A0ABQ5KB89_9EUKA|nr:hypothetical protein ADUPG1_014224 [Aduncisulcus paluster]|eukprot:gnl/Carplike_NY0171/4947_a6745_322.p1 GENE.gnl/Carplike_NY0171/4947_a6745_322~~gnl/Carplike_NY0171/4947_a6745_322.p1  ORF type:complete len:268 (-),score=29.35 gnl/Carplike_NY0171/4947_a6745_322:51-854(-)